MSSFFFLQITELKIQRCKLQYEFGNISKDMKKIDKSFDMNKLTQLREEIKLIDEELKTIQAEVNGKSDVMDIPPQQQKQDQNNNVLDTSMELDTVYHCLQLSVCLLEDVELKSYPKSISQIRALLDSLVSIDIEL